jgi:hypothetical protein
MMRLLVTLMHMYLYCVKEYGTCDIQKWLVIKLSAVYNEFGVTFEYCMWNTYNLWLIPHSVATSIKSGICGTQIERERERESEGERESVCARARVCVCDLGPATLGWPRSDLGCSTTENKNKPFSSNVCAYYMQLCRIYRQHCKKAPPFLVAYLHVFFFCFPLCCLQM